MAGRPPRKPDEIRAFILSVSIKLIEEEGLAGFSARELARRIKYSPGTIYNHFSSLDHLILTIEGGVLDQLAEALEAVPHTGDPRARLSGMADAYLRFTHDNPKLWNLLFEHHLPNGLSVSQDYQAKLERPLRLIEEVLAQIKVDAGPQDVKRSARVLWASVHGITSLSTTDKLSNVTSDSAPDLVKDLLSTYLDGWTASSG